MNDITLALRSVISATGNDTNISRYDARDKLNTSTLNKMLGMIGLVSTNITVDPTSPSFVNTGANIGCTDYRAINLDNGACPSAYIRDVTNRGSSHDHTNMGILVIKTPSTNFDRVDESDFGYTVTIPSATLTMHVQHKVKAMFINKNSHPAIVIYTNSYNSKFETRLVRYLLEVLPMITTFADELHFSYRSGCFTPTDIARDAVEIFDKVNEHGTWSQTSIEAVLEQYTQTRYSDALVNKEKYANKARLDTMLTYLDENAGSYVTSAIKELEIAIADLETVRLKELYTTLHNKQKELVLLQNVDPASIKDIADMFPSVQVLNVSRMDVSMNIVLKIITPLVHFVADDLKAIKKGGRVSEYNELSDALKALLDAIFIDKTIRLTIEQDITFVDLFTDNVRPTKYNERITATKGIPNPHHQRYNCWGDYGIPITKALKQLDIYGAVMLVKNAVAGINLLDAPVFREFIKYIRELRVPCLTVIETNETITISEYCKRYELQKTEALKKEQEAAAMKMAEPVVEETPITTTDIPQTPTDTVDVQPQPATTRRRRTAATTDTEPTVLPVIG